MAREIDPHAAELDALREEVAALREEVAALRHELTSGPLAAVARDERRAQIAAEYWHERYAGEPAPA
jgi:cell division protein FtsB